MVETAEIIGKYSLLYIIVGNFQKSHNQFSHMKFNEQENSVEQLYFPVFFVIYLTNTVEEGYYEHINKFNNLFLIFKYN